MQLVIIRTFDNYFLANIILTKLHSAGIECYLQDEFTVTIDPILSNAIGGIKLVVKKEDEVLARLLLETYESEYMKAATCPTCGSNSFTYITKPGVKNYLTVLFTWVFSSYAVAPYYVYHCELCGFESERLPENLITEPFDSY
jgi:Putative prokaryotic signal transducing protein